MEKWQKLTGLCQEEIIVFIGCGKKKSYRKNFADRMYLGNYFRTCFSLAKKLTTKNNIYILSAKYGLLKLTDVIEPYELKLTSLSKEDRIRWSKKVKKQMKHLKGKRIFICSEKYSENLKGVKLLPKVGMGYQLKWMKGLLCTK